MKISFKKAAGITIGIWLVTIYIYGVVSVSNMMELLNENPSQDLYANNLGFQVIAFILTKGVISIILLGLVLLLEARLLVTPNKALNSQPSAAGTPQSGAH